MRVDLPGLSNARILWPFWLPGQPNHASTALPSESSPQGADERRKRSGPDEDSVRN